MFLSNSSCAACAKLSNVVDVSFINDSVSFCDAEGSSPVTFSRISSGSWPEVVVLEVLEGSSSKPLPESDPDLGPGTSGLSGPRFGFRGTRFAFPFFSGVIAAPDRHRIEVGVAVCICQFSKEVVDTFNPASLAFVTGVVGAKVNLFLHEGPCFSPFMFRRLNTFSANFAFIWACATESTSGVKSGFCNPFLE